MFLLMISWFDNDTSHPSPSVWLFRENIKSFWHTEWSIIVHENFKPDSFYINTLFEEEKCQISLFILIGTSNLKFIPLHVIVQNFIAPPVLIHFAVCSYSTRLILPSWVYRCILFKTYTDIKISDWILFFFDWSMSRYKLVGIQAENEY